MKGTRNLGTLTALATVAVVSISLAMGGSPASGQEDLHLVASGLAGKAVFIDHNEDGRLTLGDELEAKGPLQDEQSGKRVGKLFLHCAAVSPITPADGTYRCSYILNLARGTIHIEGLDPHGTGTSTFAVLGGTGAYRGATGEAVLTDTQEATDFVIDLAG